MSMLHTRAAYAGTKAANDGRKVHTFKATTAATDRQGEIVTAAGWKTANYTANPVVLDAHNYGTIGAILGKCLEVRATGDGLEADIVFAKTAAGELAEALVEDGMLNAVSVGFQSLKRERGAKAGDPLRHTEKDLMEISMVPVPANPEALRLRAIVTRSADFAEVLDLSDRLSAHRRARWAIDSALNTANAAAVDDAGLTTEGKLAAIGANLAQYTAALLAWYGSEIDLAAEAEAAGMEDDYRWCAPDAVETKAGRTHSAETVKTLRGMAQSLDEHAKGLHAMCDKAEQATNPDTPETDPEPPAKAADTPETKADEGLARLLELAQAMKAATGQKELNHG